MATMRLRALAGEHRARGALLRMHVPFRLQERAMPAMLLRDLAEEHRAHGALLRMHVPFRL